MFTPITALQANATANIDMIALQAKANMRFISLSTEAINNAVAQGLTSVVLRSLENCNLTNLVNYYNGLGYQVAFPDLKFNQMPTQNPFSAFGTDYSNWLLGTALFAQVQNPARIKLYWNVPSNPAVLPVISTHAADYTMTQNNETVWADSSSADIEISLPLAPANGWVETITKPAAANTVSILGNGNNINGAGAPLVLEVVDSSATLIFMVGYGWSVFP